jgi:hypothetical protein
MKWWEAGEGYIMSEIRDDEDEIYRLCSTSGNKSNTDKHSASELYRLTTATSRRILVTTFGDRGVSRGQRDGSPTAVNVGFIDCSRYIFFQVAPHLYSRG